MEFQAPLYMTSTKSDLDYLYKNWVLTIEGLCTESLPDLTDWLVENGVENISDLQYWVTLGKVMNQVYRLTGTNAYPDDLTIVSCVGIDTTPVILKRFSIGGRWFTDIVDNNQRREDHKKRKRC